jgi:uncharacterized protein with HXXEE motif
MRDRNIMMLLWAFPIALSVHVFDEFAFPGGLIQWIRTYRPRKPRSDLYYVVVNAAAIVGAIIVAVTATGILGYRIYLNSVALMAGNAASHIRGTIQKNRYCPGTASSALALIPLCIISYWYFLSTGRVDFASAVVCFCAGIVVGFFVFGVDIRRGNPG